MNFGEREGDEPRRRVRDGAGTKRRSSKAAAARREDGPRSPEAWRARRRRASDARGRQSDRHSTESAHERLNSQLAGLHRKKVIRARAPPARTRRGGDGAARRGGDEHEVRDETNAARFYGGVGLQLEESTRERFLRLAKLAKRVARGAEHVRRHLQRGPNQTVREGAPASRGRGRQPGRVRVNFVVLRATNVRRTSTDTQNTRIRRRPRSTRTRDDVSAFYPDGLSKTKTKHRTRDGATTRLRLPDRRSPSLFFRRRARTTRFGDTHTGGPRAGARRASRTRACDGSSCGRARRAPPLVADHHQHGRRREPRRTGRCGGDAPGSSPPPDPGFPDARALLGRHRPRPRRSRGRKAPPRTRPEGHDRTGGVTARRRGPRASERGGIAAERGGRVSPAAANGRRGGETASPGRRRARHRLPPRIRPCEGDSNAASRSSPPRRRRARRRRGRARPRLREVRRARADAAPARRPASPPRGAAGARATFDPPTRTDPRHGNDNRRRACSIPEWLLPNVLSLSRCAARPGGDGDRRVRAGPAPAVFLGTPRGARGSVRGLVAGPSPRSGGDVGHGRGRVEVARPRQSSSPSSARANRGDVYSA